MVEEKNNQRELIYKKMRLIKQHTDSFQNFVNRFVRKIGRIKADKDFSFATRNRKILSEVKIFSNNFDYQIEKINNHILLSDADVLYFEKNKDKINKLKKEHKKDFMGFETANKIEEDILDGRN